MTPEWQQLRQPLVLWVTSSPSQRQLRQVGLVAVKVGWHLALDQSWAAWQAASSPWAIPSRPLSIKSSYFMLFHVISRAHMSPSLMAWRCQNDTAMSGVSLSLCPEIQERLTGKAEKPSSEMIRSNRVKSSYLFGDVWSKNRFAHSCELRCLVRLEICIYSGCIRPWWYTQAACQSVWLMDKPLTNPW